MPHGTSSDTGTIIWTASIPSSIVFSFTHFGQPVTMSILNRGVVATDNENTYACFIFPDAEATGNANGGLDWGSEETTFLNVGFEIDDYYSYSVPDAHWFLRAGVAGIDGVREWFPSPILPSFFIHLSLTNSLHSRRQNSSDFHRNSRTWPVLLFHFRRKCRSSWSCRHHFPFQQ